MCRAEFMRSFGPTIPCQRPAIPSNAFSAILSEFSKFEPAFIAFGASMTLSNRSYPFELLKENPMKRLVLSVAVSVLMFCWIASAADAAKELDAAAQVLQNMASSNQIPTSLLNQAKCIAVIPKLTKAGFIVGGKHGNGVVNCRTASGWGAPGFITITGGSVGLQAGGEKQDVVLLMNAQGAEEL